MMLPLLLAVLENGLDGIAFMHDNQTLRDISCACGQYRHIYHARKHRISSKSEADCRHHNENLSRH